MDHDDALREALESCTDALNEAIDPTFRSLAASVTDNLILLDREGRIRYINYTVPDLSVEQVKPGVLGTRPVRSPLIVTSCVSLCPAA